MMGRSVGLAFTRGLTARGRLLRTALLGTTALVALGAALAPSPSHAADWTGANSTDWFDPGNWSGGVPTNATGALINTVTPNPTVVDGAAAQAQGMQVGQSGNGILTIQNGGTLSSGSDTFIGYNAGVTGAVTVSGAGSSWTSAVGIFLGWVGIGTLTIENGGAVNSALEVVIGYQGSGTVTVNGSGSSLTTGSLSVGDFGTGTLTIENGGAVSNASG
jgi:T5SS/PEP-CTERM-associated repeat protein